MKLLLLHLSDIHLKANRDKNPALGRAGKIVDAVAGIMSDAEGCLVVVSGDTAYSGTKTEYALANELYHMVLKRLAAVFGARPIKLVVVPGNHDCDFSKNDYSRNVILSHAKASEFPDESPLTACLSVQSSYVEFARALPSSLTEFECAILDGWFKEVRLSFGPNAVVFNLLNTAWCSQLHEKTRCTHVSSASS